MSTQSSIIRALDFMLTGQFLEEGQWDRYNIAKTFNFECIEGSDGKFFGQKINTSRQNTNELFNLLGDYKKEDYNHIYELSVLVKKYPVALDFNLIRDNYNLNIDVLRSEEQNFQVNRTFSLQNMVFECKINIKLLTSPEEDYLQKLEITAEGNFSEIINGEICNLDCLHSSEKPEYSDDPVSILLDFMLSGKFLDDGAWSKYYISRLFHCEFMLGLDTTKFSFKHFKKSIDTSCKIDGRAFFSKNEKISIYQITVFPLGVRFNSKVKEIGSKYSINMRREEKSPHQSICFPYSTEFIVHKPEFNKSIKYEVIFTSKLKTPELIDDVHVTCIVGDI